MKVIPKPKRKIFYKILKECYNMPFTDGHITGIITGKHIISMDNTSGFCYNIQEINDELDLINWDCDDLFGFPELNKYAPVKLVDYAYWFPYDEKGYLKRQEIINEVCKDLNI